MHNAPILIHPAVFTDQRYVDALQIKTGRRIIIDRTGRAHLAQPAAPVTRVSIFPDLTGRQRNLIRSLRENDPNPKGAA